MPIAGSAWSWIPTDLPNYEIPPMNGIGTQEAIMDVTHGLVDFLSGCDTNPIAELNAWYHMMNCGFRMKFVGETDYPCITDERMGVGRSYVRLDHRPVGDAGYEAWVRGIAEGRLYCGDGRSHFLDFKVNGRRSGEGDLSLKASGTLEIETLVAARLEPEPPVDMDRNPAPPQRLAPGARPHRHDRYCARGTHRQRRRGRQGDAGRRRQAAHHHLQSAHCPKLLGGVAHIPVIPYSSGVCDGRRQTDPCFETQCEWCRACVDKVWEVKSPFMRESERPAGAEAFDHARKVYEAIASECEIA